MNEHLRPEDAAQALTKIRQRQQQVIDLAVLPNWYWWTIGVLMVILGVGVDAHTPAAVGTTVAVFVLGVLATTSWVLANAFRQAQLRNRLLDVRGVAPILGLVTFIVGLTLGIAFTLRATGVPHPATLACLVGGLGRASAAPS
jgi:hypothetical protein